MIWLTHCTKTKALTAPCNMQDVRWLYDQLGETIQTHAVYIVTFWIVVADMTQWNNTHALTANSTITDFRWLYDWPSESIQPHSLHIRTLWSCVDYMTQRNNTHTLIVYCHIMDFRWFYDCPSETTQTHSLHIVTFRKEKYQLSSKIDQCITVNGVGPQIDRIVVRTFEIVIVTVCVL